MSTALPALPCPSCGSIAVPHISAGTGPHTARLACASCGRFLKWAPKVLIHPSPTKRETFMQASVNHCVLLGTISERGVEVSYHGQGTAKAAFMLILSEMGSDGKVHQLWQPVEIWGKRAEQVGELDAGAVVLVDGKLRRVKKGESQWETVIAAWDATPVQLPATTLSHSN
jgi:hypothetical protein